MYGLYPWDLQVWLRHCLESLSSSTHPLVFSVLLTIGQYSPSAICIVGLKILDLMSINFWMTIWAVARSSILSFWNILHSSFAWSIYFNIWVITRCDQSDYSLNGLMGFLLQKAFLTFLVRNSSSQWSLVLCAPLSLKTKRGPWTQESDLFNLSVAMTWQCMPLDWVQAMSIKGIISHGRNAPLEKIYPA